MAILRAYICNELQNQVKNGDTAWTGKESDIKIINNNKKSVSSNAQSLYQLCLSSNAKGLFDQLCFSLLMVYARGYLHQSPTVFPYIFATGHVQSFGIKACIKVNV